MARMLSRLGSNSTLEGAEALANDPAALDRLFERMSDPAMLEKLQEMAQSEGFQEKVKRLSSDPAFAEAAGKYADEMNSDIRSDVAGAGEDADADPAVAEALGDDLVRDEDADLEEEEEEDVA